MKNPLFVVLLMLLPLSCFAFEGIYSFRLPVDDIQIKINSDGLSTILSTNPMNYAISSTLRTNDCCLDIVISWINDGSPELTRIIMTKDAYGKIAIAETFTVFNDGDPIAIKGAGVKLLSSRTPFATQQ